MALSPADKKWLRKMVREEFKKVHAEILADSVQQIGGYDGAHAYVDDDDTEGRKVIGFHTNRSTVTTDK